MSARGRIMLAAALLAAVLVSPVAAGSASASAGAGAARLVGWDVYRRLDRLAELPASAETRQFSSFDRTGDNNDGFDGTFSCLRQSEDGCVIAEAAGAGELTAIWFTADIFDPGHLGALGNIVIELDGQRVIDMPLQDLVDGKRGAPFVYPLVANRQQSSGGSYLKVPMPYRHSMRITTENRANFYHVTYRRFADATGVHTFDPRDRATDVLAMLRAAGTADPKPGRPGGRTEQRSADLRPGESAELARMTGPGTVSELSVRLPQVVGPRVRPQIVDDGRGLKTGFTEFTVAVDPGNDGVRLTRRVDTFWAADQQAAVFVEGEPAGRWTALPSTWSSRWVDITLDVPAALTAGKSRITVRTEPVASPLNGFQEFSYWVHSRVGGELVRTDELDVGPESVPDETAHGYRIETQVWEGSTRATYAPGGDPAAIAASDAVLKGLRLRITFDGTTTVDAPVGEFFGSGLGEYDVSSLMFSMDAGGNGWYRSWWPMPFRHSAVVELVNASGRPVAPADVRVRWARAPENEAGLGPRGDLGYFRATSRRGEAEPGQDWRFVDVRGRGRLVGVSQTMNGHLTQQLTQRGYLEGDERVYVDGARTPQLYGTGTEDFYEGAWYFAFGTFSNPQNGNTAFEVQELGCTVLCDSMYRLMIGDAVEFGSSLRFGIEHGHGNEWPAEYGSTAFWYGRDDPGLTRTDVLDVGNADSERAHRFTGTGEPVSLTSVFEGDDDDVRVTDSGRAGPDRSSFRLAIDPANRGVVLRRRGDQSTGYQDARVLVGGRDAGRWLQPLANPTQRWLEDTFVLPARLTAGRVHLDITVVPAAGAPGWHAARYEALSIRGWGR